MAPALPVFAAKAAPTGTALTQSLRNPCGSGHARETGDAVDGTGFAGVRGRARSHRDRAGLRLMQFCGSGFSREGAGTGNTVIID